MSIYAADHAGALADIAAAGAPVTFTKATSTYDPATDTQTAGADSTVAGQAIRLPADPIKYQSLGLVQREAVTLLFAPTTIGQLPTLSASVTWNSLAYTVRDVEPLALDGTAILATIVVAR